MVNFDRVGTVYCVSLDFFLKKCYAYNKVIWFHMAVRWNVARLRHGKLYKKYIKGDCPVKRAMIRKVDEGFLRKRCVGVKGQKAVSF